MATYHVEYGALQANACRLIECETSAYPAKKISENFARRIAYGLNMTEPGAMRYIPDDSDLDALDQLADSLINSSTYGGGIIKTMVRDYRDLKKRHWEFINAQRDSDGFPLPAEKTEGGWYGFDLDGTLATYDGWKGIDHIGEPVKPMVDLIKRMHDEGRVVKIVTDRVAPCLCGETHAQGCRCGHCEEEAGKPPVLQEPYLSELDENGISVKRTASDYIHEWCRKNLGFVPETVYQKDNLMVELYRVKQVATTKGD